MRYPNNRRIMKSFPYPAEPLDSWFDKHPFVSGGIVGAVLALIMFFGLTF